MTEEKYMNDLFDHQDKVGTYLKKMSTRLKSLRSNTIPKEVNLDELDISECISLSMMVSSNTSEVGKRTILTRFNLNEANLERIIKNTYSSMDEYVDEEPSYEIDEYNYHLNKILSSIEYRRQDHDESKMIEPEMSGYMKMIEELISTEYGSPKYEEVKVKYQPILDHHFEHNRHHPEYHSGGVESMSLVDIVEMIADWGASSERSSTSLEDGLKINFDRYDIKNVNVMNLLMNHKFE